MFLFQLTPHDDFLLAEVSGLVSLEAWQKLLRELELALAPLPGDRLMLDLMGLLGWLGVPERQAVGALMATHFKRMKKVAIFIQAHKITNVVKDEARRGGLALQLFSSRDEALAWLTSPQ